MRKTYTEMCSLPTFEERFRYLQLNGAVGSATFGGARYLNQALYKSDLWKRTKRKVILRDNGCDLGIEGREIMDKIYVHHINPISAEDILNRDPVIFDPENLVTVSLNTHNAIHYSSEDILVKLPEERRPNDTCPWRKE